MNRKLLLGTENSRGINCWGCLSVEVGPSKDDPPPCTEIVKTTELRLIYWKKFHGKENHREGCTHVALVEHSRARRTGLPEFKFTVYAGVPEKIGAKHTSFITEVKSAWGSLNERKYLKNHRQVCCYCGADSPIRYGHPVIFSCTGRTPWILVCLLIFRGRSAAWLLHWIFDIAFMLLPFCAFRIRARSRHLL